MHLCSHSIFKNVSHFLTSMVRVQMWCNIHHICSLAYSHPTQRSSLLAVMHDLSQLPLDIIENVDNYVRRDKDRFEVFISINVFIGVCWVVCICLSVRKITQKVMDGCKRRWSVRLEEVCAVIFRYRISVKLSDRRDQCETKSTW